jgi:transposase
MITVEIRTQIRRLVLVEGIPIETVARRFGVHHSTVRRALDDAPVLREGKPGLLEPFKPYIVDRLTELPELSGKRLFEELRGRGYAGSVCILRRYVMQVRHPRARKAYLRIEVDPGEQAQVDWGSFGHFRIGQSQRPVSAFVMVLSWSRAMYVDFSLDQQMETFLRMHNRAFQFFGGIPKKILYDNLKSVVLHHVGSTVQFNPRFLQLAGHYLFETVAAPVRYPEAKGKVENSIKFVRQSFFYGRSFSSLADLREQSAQWRDQTANVRLHGTTRERPSDRLLIERKKLRALPERAFDCDIVLPCIVSKECRVRLDTNTYSVPHQYVGRTVNVRADDVSVRIICDGTEIARHVRSWDRRRAVENPAHIDALLDRKKSALAPKRRERIAALGPECRLYLQEVARRRIHLENEIRKLIRLWAIYGPEELARGIAKAVATRAFGAVYVRALIDQDRFARGLAEPPDPVVTGNSAADDVVVQPHDLESYDALFPKTAPDDKPTE